MSSADLFWTLDRQIKLFLRSLDDEKLSKAEKAAVAEIKKALRVLRLDVRDYEYAETRTEQLKWAKIAKNNLHVLENSLFALGGHLGPADIAELSARIDLLKSSIE